MADGTVVAARGTSTRRLARLAHRWADRSVRVSAAAALRRAGRADLAGVLSMLPEVHDDETLGQARDAVDGILQEILTQARDADDFEQAVLVAIAAREAVALAAAPLQSLSSSHLRGIVDAVHVMHGPDLVSAESSQTETVPTGCSEPSTPASLAP